MWGIQPNWTFQDYKTLLQEIAAAEELNASTAAFIYQGQKKNGTMTARHEARNAISLLNKYQILKQNPFYIKVEEHCDSIWATDTCYCETDKAWAKEFIAEVAVELGLERAGIVTWSWAWADCGWGDGSEYPLIYTGGQQNGYFDFQSFGGWDAPAAKFWYAPEEAYCDYLGDEPQISGYFGVSYVE